MIFEGGRDFWLDDDEARLPRWVGWSIAMVLGLAAWAGLVWGISSAFAQAGAGGPVPNVVGSQYLATPNAVADKQLVPIRVDNDGTVHVTGTSTVSGTVTASQGAAAAASGAWPVTSVVGTTGGATASFLQPTASDNHANIKNGAGTLYGAVGFNNSVTINYLRYYNAGTGFNGCNSASNLIAQFQIPPSGGYSIQVPVGIAFATGLSICVTSGYATNDTTNATASAMSVTTLYN